VDVGAPKSTGARENGMKKEWTMQEELAKSLANMRWLRRRKVVGCSGVMGPPQATLEHFDRMVCAS
jgi:hypothetical protein